MAAMELTSFSSTGATQTANSGSSASEETLLELVSGPVGNGRVQRIEKLLETGRADVIVSDTRRTLLHILALRTQQTQQPEELQEDHDGCAQLL